MSLRFQPVKSNNAIDDFFVSVRFARQLTDSAFSDLITLARALASKSNLPAENQQTNMTVAFDQQSGLLQAQPTVGVGINFQRFNSSGLIEEELRLDRNSVGYRTTSYDRWSTIQNKMENIILPLAQRYSLQVPVLESIVLQYVDRFTSDEIGGIDWTDLFSVESPWVASGILSTTDAWHSHIGRFESGEDILPARRLINVNIDVGEPMVRLGLGGVPQSLAILTLCTDQFIWPESSPFIVNAETLESEIRSRFNALHNRAKEILKQVLSKPYLDRIGITSEQLKNDNT